MSRALNIEHDTRPCTPNGHSAFRGYDAYVGKVRSLGTADRPFPCGGCERRFKTAAARDQHQHDFHTGEGA
jgi:hypothetical protein